LPHQEASSQAAKLSAQVAKRTLDIYIDKERARLSIGVPEDMEHPFSFVDLQPHPISRMALYNHPIEVHKSGPTDAVRIRLFARVEVASRITPPALDRAYQIDEIRDSMSGQAPFTTQVSISVDQEQIDAIVEARQLAYMYGYITWDDIFGNSYRYEFYLFWNQLEEEDPPYMVSCWGGMDSREVKTKDAEDKPN
jgi:hypothetical protein